MSDDEHVQLDRSLHALADTAVSRAVIRSAPELRAAGNRRRAWAAGGAVAAAVVVATGGTALAGAVHLPGAEPSGGEPATWSGGRAELVTVMARLGRPGQQPDDAWYTYRVRDDRGELVVDRTLRRPSLAKIVRLAPGDYRVASVRHVPRVPDARCHADVTVQRDDAQSATVRWFPDQCDVQVPRTTTIQDVDDTDDPSSPTASTTPSPPSPSTGPDTMPPTPTPVD